ncbi:hypothetical protein GCM10018777_56780 [Streptomyces albogriseolus]|uniref:hypothetical protein n=1 Tax=Streptomyces TaxID=1883 RepID=UPI0016765CC1|nr:MULTISPECIES: hypothetical protein [Streptomyces]GHB16032.1 hypothetical protein GCM10010330_81350 [Streptomyces tendae]GHG33272.1 hypothetical protein GCM10018777_56780 [Streptomyces viridodiastaticus]
MNTVHAYRVAKALASMGHTNSPVIPRADMEMAATLTDVPRPETTADRAQVCEALDCIESEAADAVLEALTLKETP